MTKILFICHGNICRSPTAEFVMKELVSRAGLESEFEIASAATSTEELGSPVYPPSRRKLAEHGIDCSGKTARQMRKNDYEYYDLLIGMDDRNIYNMHRLFGGDAQGKIRTLMSYAGRPEASVADPWYTRDFDSTWRDVVSGCCGMLKELCGIEPVDFSACRSRSQLFDELRRHLDWQDWYGENLDALYDILSGFPLKDKDRRYVVILPGQDAPTELKNYADKIVSVFEEAGIPVFTAP